MRSLFPFRLFGAAPEDTEAVSPGLAESVASSTQTSLFPDEPEGMDARSTLVKTIGWVTAGLGAIAIGLVVGREMRKRYKFNRRTPYDLYAHAGDEHDLEFGVGI